VAGAGEVEEYIRLIASTAGTSAENLDAMTSWVRRMIPLEWTHEQQFKGAVAIAHALGTSGMDGWYKGHADLRRIKGTKNSRISAAAKADKRDRAAFYERWWEKRGRHLADGREPKTSKERLLKEIMPTLPEGEWGSSESTVGRAIDRWEQELKSRAPMRDRT